MYRTIIMPSSYPSNTPASLQSSACRSKRNSTTAAKFPLPIRLRMLTWACKAQKKQNGLQRRLACVPGKTKAFKSPMLKSLAAVAGIAAQASPLSYMVFSSRLLVFVVLCCEFGPLVSFRASSPSGPRARLGPLVPIPRSYSSRLFLPAAPSQIHHPA